MYMNPMKAALERALNKEWFETKRQELRQRIADKQAIVNKKKAIINKILSKPKRK